MHEGDRYFERCYAADYEVRVAVADKEACWTAWTSHYTKHQPAHRVDYALRRIEAIQNGEPAPSLPGLGRGPLPSGSLSSAEVDAEVQAASVESSNNSAALLTTISLNDGGPVPNGCLNYCNQYESRCNGRCPGTSTTCRLGCERERQLCLNGCH